MFHELLYVLPTGFLDVVMLSLLRCVHRKIRSSEVGYQCRSCDWQWKAMVCCGRIILLVLVEGVDKSIDECVVDFYYLSVFD